MLVMLSGETESFRFYQGLETGRMHAVDVIRRDKIASLSSELRDAGWLYASNITRRDEFAGHYLF